MFYCARAALPLLKKQSGSLIVNIASVAGISGMGSSIVCAASKAAITLPDPYSLARALAPEVRVNAVAPGFVRTRFANWPSSAFDEGEAQSPLGRTGNSGGHRRGRHLSGPFRSYHRRDDSRRWRNHHAWPAIPETYVILAEALALIEPFDLQGDELGLKSKDLIVNLLRHSLAPFSRDQFNPGHITCTALIFNPGRRQILLMWHHRFRRWLLPGGHVEPFDASLAATARREAIEETAVRLSAAPGVLAGMDVHGIPPKKKEPYQLHHDLVFAMQAASEEIAATEEAPQVAWCDVTGLDRYDVPANIVRAALRSI